MGSVNEDSKNDDSQRRSVPELSVGLQIADVIEVLTPRLIELSHGIHVLAETAFEEERSVALISELLLERRISPEIGVGGLATAFRAEVGRGTPRVAVLAEYDALPGVGHACGHNLICAAALGAFLGLASHMSQLVGSVVLIGTPAEETGNGKELLARAGIFRDVDAAVMLHPFTGRDVANFNSLAVRDIEVTYYGVAAHASSAPQMGRNALDAVVAAYQGLAALRQHIPSSDRIHAIITEGGSATNVVPERASAVIELRSSQIDSLLGLSSRVQRIIEAAADMTGTRLEANWDPFPAYLPVRSNGVLADRYAHHIAGRGREIVGTLPGLVGGGWSTDLGNVSVRLPAIHPTLAIASDDVGMHTAQFAERAISGSAHAAMIDGAVSLALTLVDFMSDVDLRGAVAADFLSSGGPIDVEGLMRSPERS